MKPFILAVTFVALLLLPVNAIAACTSSIGYDKDGNPVFCMTCCSGSMCTTTCA